MQHGYQTHISNGSAGRAQTAMEMLQDLPQRALDGEHTQDPHKISAIYNLDVEHS
jgi:hypothetical protein